jgi:hypothetical protein
MKTTENVAALKKFIETSAKGGFASMPFASMYLRVHSYNNSHLCGECTGAGCKQCYDPLKLREQGTITFPVSHMVSDCRPQSIAQPITKPQNENY